MMSLSKLIYITPLTIILFLWAHSHFRYTANISIFGPLRIEGAVSYGNVMLLVDRQRPSSFGFTISINEYSKIPPLSIAGPSIVQTLVGQKPLIGPFSRGGYIVRLPICLIATLLIVLLIVHFHWARKRAEQRA